LGVFNVPFKLLLKSRKIMTRLVNLTIWIWQERQPWRQFVG
jgi:hypothetical protein